jgi:hypothetical protein
MNVRKVSEMDKALRRAELRAEWAKRARVDPIAFLEFILRTEKINPKTGKQERIRLADMQVEMVEFCLKNRRGVIVASPKVGKSQLITIGLTLWIAGRDKAFRSAIGSLKQDFATYFTSQIKEHVESNEDLHLVFPHMRPMPGRWSVEKLYLDRDGARVVHPTWRAVGAETGQQGTRVVVNALDDVQDQESTDTEARSDKTLRWIYAGESRMDKLSGDYDLADHAFGSRGYDDERVEDAEVVDFGEDAGPSKIEISKRAGYRWLITNALRPYDAAHKLVSEDEWAYHEARVRDAKTGKTRLPAVYSQADIDNYSKKNAARDLDTQVKVAGEQLIQEAWIQAAKLMGSGLTLTPQLAPEVAQQIREMGGRIVSGVDLASRKNKKSDHTVFWVALVAPLTLFRRLVAAERFQGLNSMLPGHTLLTRPLWIERRKMHSPEIREALYRLDAAFCRPVWVVENNGAQDYIRQDIMVERRDITVFPFYTGAIKNDPEQGVEGAICNDMAAGLYIIPSMPMPGSPETLVCEPVVEQWVQEMRDFTRGAHTGDSLMASWFVREHVFSRPAQTRGVGSIDTSSTISLSPLASSEPGATPKTPEQAEVDDRVRRRFGFG